MSDNTEQEVACLPMYGRQIAERESSLRAGPAESEYGIIPFGIAVGESGTAGFVR